MLAAGAAEVVGVDPTLVFCLQHRAVNGYVKSRVNHVLRTVEGHLAPVRALVVARKPVYSRMANPVDEGSNHP